MIDSFVHPYAKFKYLPLINFIWVGWGTTLTGLLKEGGPCFKTVAVGFISTVCFYWGFGLMYFTLFLSLIISLAVYILNALIGYKAYKAAC